MSRTKKINEWLFNKFYRVLKFGVFEVKEWHTGHHRYEIEEYVVCYGIKGVPFFWRKISSYNDLKYAIETKDNFKLLQKNPRKKRRLKEHEEVLEMIE